MCNVYVINNRLRTVSKRQTWRRPTYFMNIKISHDKTAKV